MDINTLSVALTEVGVPVSFVSDGKRVRVEIVCDDQDTMDAINGNECYGQVAMVDERARYTHTYERANRPAGFTGAAIKLRTGYGDAYWWEPSRDGHHVYNTPADRRIVQNLMEYGFYGIIVKVDTLCGECGQNDPAFHAESSLWGLDSVDSDGIGWILEDLFHELDVNLA